MNFKYLDRKLDRILNEATGFGFTSRAEELPDKLQELVDKYGNLTIPEFIDKLMQDNENLEESLNESLFSSKYSKFEEVPGGNLGTMQGEILGQPVRYSISIFMGHASSIPYYFNKFVQNGYKEQFRLGTKGSYTDNLYYIPEPIQSKVCHPCYFVYDKERKIWNSVSYCGRLDAYPEYWETLKFNSEEITENEAKTWLSDYIQESPLEKLRKKTTQNSKTKNTTVRQALSKSTIAKKIQALQNPTPEQLAKILAAIEE